MSDDAQTPPTFSVDSADEAAAAGASPHAGPAAPATAGDERLNEQPGSSVGPYRLLEQIGEGGMGVVFMAEQLRPVRRRVALKVIKPGMDSRRVVARFEAERQALALMDHPNIAKVFDGGATEAGRPYFVMELVRGVPVTEYCDKHQLAVPQRLALFAKVCDAVQHAHQKGIIHRDIKPSNVLVTVADDGTPVPKVIDFGVAKATAGQRLTEGTLFTEFRQLLGTPLYMSPEQAEMSPLQDVDTRSDVYSLGVLLYELLTGTTPFEKRRMADAAQAEVLRIIREEDPPTPSTRLSSLRETLASVAAVRKTDPRKLGHVVRGELDWIVMRALEKDRGRRYETASALARDVSRYLADEPVEARPATARYRLGKFLRRHKGPAIAASLLLASLVAGVVGTSVGLARERTAKTLAEGRLEQVENANTAERAAKQLAERRLAHAENSNKILGSVFRDLDPTTGEDGRPLRVILGERLDQAASQLEGEAVGNRATVAVMQVVLGQSQLGLGYAEKAVKVLTSARRSLEVELGPDHPATLASMHELAAAHRLAGRGAAALPLFQQVVAKRRRVLGPDHPETIDSMHQLAVSTFAAWRPVEALPLFERVWEKNREVLGPDHRRTLLTQHDLALCYYDSGRLADALPLFEQGLAKQRTTLGPNAANTLRTMRSLGLAYVESGRFDEGVPLFEEALRGYQERFGPDHPETLSTMSLLGSTYGDLGRFSDGLPLEEQALARQREKLGPDHLDALRSMYSLASSYGRAGRLDDAVRTSKEVLSLSRAKLGPDHPDTLRCAAILASAYVAKGQDDEALPLLEDTLTRRREVLGPDHKATLASENDLAKAYQRAGRLTEALPLFERTVARMRAKFGPKHQGTLIAMNNLAMAYDADRRDEALGLLEQVVAGLRETLGEDHPTTLQAMNNLGGKYADARRFDEATALSERALAKQRERLGPDHPQTLRTMYSLGLTYEKAARLADALPLYEQVLTKQRAVLEPGHPDTLKTIKSLAAAYEAAGRSEEAKPLLKELEAPNDKAAPEPQN